MKIIKIISAMMFLLISTKEIKAQIPLNDPTWSLQPLSDNFNGSSLNSTKWYDRYEWGRVSNGYEYNDAANLLFTSSSGQTYLTIKCDTMAPMYHPRPTTHPLDDSLRYRSGAIYSKAGYEYKYGYWEMSAKLPAGYEGYWPAFWLWGAPGDIPGCHVDSNDIINEIDIMENGGGDSQYTDKMGMNYHWRDANCEYGNMANSFVAATQTVPGNTTAEHKYSMFWEPGKMTWYFDDIPIKIIVDPLNTPSYALRTIINFAIPPKGDYVPLPTTIFPAYFHINYLNVWQLVPSASNCGTVENICTFNAGAYSYQVKKSVSIGGSGCTSSINTSSNVNFWATDFVLLQEGTTITDNGSGSFSANTTNCPN